MTDGLPGPLIVQSDKTLLLEVDHPAADDCRRAIAPFAELERAPEHMHTYRLTPLGLWNARAAGHDAEQVVSVLLAYSRYPVPHALLVDVAETMARYGRLQLVSDPVHGLVLHALDRAVLAEVLRSRKAAGLLGARIDADDVAVHPSERGRLKQVLLSLGWPVEDLAGYVDGEAHPIDLDLSTWSLRPYQGQAVDSFWHGGPGLVVLPCGPDQVLARPAGQHHDAGAAVPEAVNRLHLVGPQRPRGQVEVDRVRLAVDVAGQVLDRPAEAEQDLLETAPFTGVHRDVVGVDPCAQQPGCLPGPEHLGEHALD